MRGGEGLTALGSGDKRIAELRGGRLARTSDWNHKGRLGLFLVPCEDRQGQCNSHSKVECGFHLEQSTTKHGKDKTGLRGNLERKRNFEAGQNPNNIQRLRASDFLRDDEAFQGCKKAVELLLGFRFFVVPCLHVPGEELEARLCWHETNHPTVGENDGTFHHEKIGRIDRGERGVVLIEIPCGRDRRNGWPSLAKDFSNPFF